MYEELGRHVVELWGISKLARRRGNAQRPLNEVERKKDPRIGDVGHLDRYHGS
jgi:hypothetical protein